MNDQLRPDGIPVRLPSEVGRCPDCEGPLDCAIEGRNEQGWIPVLSCNYECDGPGKQDDWHPILVRARDWANATAPKDPDFYFNNLTISGEDVIRWLLNLQTAMRKLSDEERAQVMAVVFAAEKCKAEREAGGTMS